MYLCRSFRQRCHHFFLDFGRLYHHRFKVCLRNRQIQLVAGLDIRHFLEHGHKLRQVKELREACPRPIAGSLRSQFNSRRGFPEGGCPAVKVRQAFLLQRSVLEIPHDRVQFRHGIADRRSGRKHHALAAGDFIHIPAFHKHIRGFLRLRSGQACHVPHLRVKEQVLEGMALIHIQPVYTQLLKGDHIVLPVSVDQFIQPRLQGLSCFLHLLDGKVLAPAVFQF